MNRVHRSQGAIISSWTGLTLTNIISIGSTKVSPSGARNLSSGISGAVVAGGADFSDEDLGLADSLDLDVAGKGCSELGLGKVVIDIINRKINIYHLQFTN